MIQIDRGISSEPKQVLVPYLQLPDALGIGREITGPVISEQRGHTSFLHMQSKDDKRYLLQHTGLIGVMQHDSVPAIRCVVGSAMSAFNQAFTEALKQGNPDVLCSMQQHIQRAATDMRYIARGDVFQWLSRSDTYRERNAESNPYIDVQEYIDESGRVPFNLNLMAGTDVDFFVSKLFPDNGSMQLELGVETTPPYHGRSVPLATVVSGFVVPH
ncbi:MAG: hypothetical protein NUV52_00805 [Candidatus Roizmanbacteria bacterium]|nr:hypothetical protein [Candidatus Roizmanbacteria bacterium]